MSVTTSITKRLTTRVACLYFKEEIQLTKVAELCLRLSPQICIGKSAIFIEIGKCYHLYTEDGFLLRVQVILRKLKYTAQIAVGDDIATALVRAKYQTQQTDQLPLQTLIDFADPFGKDLAVQKNIQKMIKSFSGLGIKTIGAFKVIPLAELVSRFGPISVLCMQRLRQEIQIPWPYWQPEEVVFEKNDFPYFEFYGELEPILFKLKEQLDRIFQRLWARNLRVQKMQVRVFCETNSVSPEPFRHFEFDFITPQSATKGTLNIIKERLSKDFEKKPITTPIEALETKVLTTVPGTSGQKNLLNNHEEQLEQFHALLGQLGEAHGKENIFHAELTEDRRPEKSWKKIENQLLITPPQSMRAGLEQKAKLINRIPLRPTYLLHPEKIQITAGYVHIRKKRFKILSRSEFVERISGGWVENSDTEKKYYERNYYQFELQDAPMISVFETQDKNYYLHGYYG